MLNMDDSIMLYLIIYVELSVDSAVIATYAHKWENYAI